MYPGGAVGGFDSSEIDGGEGSKFGDEDATGYLKSSELEEVSNSDGVLGRLVVAGHPYDVLGKPGFCTALLSSYSDSKSKRLSSNRS
jgi:hypothetical protein